MTDKNDRNGLDGKARESTTTREVDNLARVPIYLQKETDAFCFIEAGYRYHLVNDVYGAIAGMIKAGWQIVEEDISRTYTEDGRAHKTQAASGAWRVVNEGNKAKAKEAVVMRIPLELWEQDNAAKHKRADNVLEQVDDRGVIRQTQILATRSNILKTT